jgi:predicted nucleic acid-binding protein
VALILLDASVVIAQLNADDALHARARDYLTNHLDDDLRLPASAYAEVLIGPSRTGRIDEMRDALASLGIGVEAITPEIAERAASLRSRSRTLTLGDAIVLATGDVLASDTVATGDRRWRRFDRVHVLR